MRVGRLDMDHGRRGHGVRRVNRRSASARLDQDPNRGDTNELTPSTDSAGPDPNRGQAGALALSTALVVEVTP